jgi:hypothetical protein
MKASDYGILNLKRDVQYLPEWTRQEGDLYTNMKRIYTGIQGQYKLYMMHVAKNIGGAYTTIKSVEEKGIVFQPVPKPVLQKAVNFYDRQLFQTPLWLYSDTVVHLLGIRILDNIGTIQSMVLNRILNAAALLQVSEMANLSKDPYTLDEYLTDMDRAIWREVYQKSSIDIYRRNLQKKYLECLGDVLNPPAPKTGGGFTIMEPGTTGSDVQSIVRGHLVSLNTAIAAALPLTNDKMTRYHLLDVRYRIAKMLDPQK